MDGSQKRFSGLMSLQEAKGIKMMKKKKKDFAPQGEMHRRRQRA